MTERERKLICAFASWLAGSGYGNAFVAQWHASAIASGGLETSETLDWMADIHVRLVELLRNEAQIWPELMPGGPGDELSREFLTTFEMMSSEDGENVCRRNQQILEHVSEAISNLNDSEVVDDIIGFMEEIGWLDRGWGENRKAQRDAVADEDPFKGDLGAQLIRSALSDRFDGQVNIQQRMLDSGLDFWMEFVGPMLDRIEGALGIDSHSEVTEPVTVMLLTNEINAHGWLVISPLTEEVDGISSADHPLFKFYIWEGTIFEPVQMNYGPDMMARKDIIKVEAADLSDAQWIANLQDVIKPA